MYIDPPDASHDGQDTDCWVKCAAERGVDTVQHCSDSTTCVASVVEADDDERTTDCEYMASITISEPENVTF